MNEGRTDAILTQNVLKRSEKVSSPNDGNRDDSSKESSMPLAREDIRNTFGLTLLYK